MLLKRKKKDSGIKFRENNIPMKKLLSLLAIVFLAFAGDAQNYFEKAILHDDKI